MKKRRPHSIPLSDHAVALLESLKTHSGHREYVFPADRNPRTHANSQTANMALKRMGFQDRLVSHGMRSMASTILNEHGWDPELIEVALAHVDKDEVRSAYNRASRARAAYAELHGATQFNDNHAFNKALLKFQEVTAACYKKPIKFVLHRNSELGLEKQVSIAMWRSGEIIDIDWLYSEGPNIPDEKLDKRLLEKYGKATPEALVESALWECSLFEEHDFRDIKISVKHNDPVVMVRAYELLAEADGRLRKANLKLDTPGGLDTSMRSRMGNANAAVFPEPVRAQARTSPPCKITGIAAA